MPGQLTKTLDDPDFRKLRPETQRAVLKKMGVSDEMTGKLLTRIAQPPTGTSTSTPTPAQPPVPQQPFLTRVSQRVGSQLHGMTQTISGAIKDIETGKAFSGPRKPMPSFFEAITAPERIIAGQASQMYEDYRRDPANLAGDVLLGEMLGGGRAPELHDTIRTTESRMGRAPREIPQVPRSIQRLSKAQRDKLSHKIDTVNREHAENMAAWQEKSEEITDRVNREHRQDLIDHAEAEGKRRGEWEQKMHGATQSAADNIAATYKKAELEHGVREYTRQAFDNIKQTHATVRGELDQRWNTLREEMRLSELSNPGEIYNGIRKAESEYLRGAPDSLQQFRNLIKELGIEDFVENEDGTLSANESGEAKPMDWETGRVHYTAIGDRLASGNLPGNVYQALKSVHSLLDNKLGAAAEAANHGAEYSLLKSDWSQYMKDWKDVSAVTGSPLARALRSPDYGYTLIQATGVSGERMLDIMEKYKLKGLRPDLLEQARELKSEIKSIKVPTVKAKPPAFEPKAPPAIKELRLPTEPRLKTIEVPVPAPEPVGPGARAAIHAAGRGAGLGLGVAAGHPYIGLGGGEVAARAVIRSIEQRRARAAELGVPPTMILGMPEPEEY